MTTTKNNADLLYYIENATTISIQCAGSGYGNYFETTSKSTNKIMDSLDEYCEIKWDYNSEDESLVIHEIIEN